MHLKRKRVFGPAIVFWGGLLLATGAQAESLFNDILKAAGSVYKTSGEAMDKVSQGREDSLIGKGFKIGGKMNKAVGAALEEAGEEWAPKKTTEE